MCAGMGWGGRIRGWLKSAQKYPGVEDGNSLKSTPGLRGVSPGPATWSPRLPGSPKPGGVRRDRRGSPPERRRFAPAALMLARMADPSPWVICSSCVNFLMAEAIRGSRGRIRTIPSPRLSRCSHFDYTQCAVTPTTLPILPADPPRIPCPAGLAGNAPAKSATADPAKFPTGRQERERPDPPRSRLARNSPARSATDRPTRGTLHPLTFLKSTTPHEHSHNPLHHNHLQQSRQST